MCTRTRSRRRGARSGARSARRYRDGRRTAQAAQYGRVDAYAVRRRTRAYICAAVRSRDVARAWDQARRCVFFFLSFFHRVL